MSGPSVGSERARAYTVRLELVDEPGELLNALEPIATHGGNLLSIYHERGSLTPRGRIPVEVDVECVPDKFDEIVAALRAAGVTVMEAGEGRYSESITLILVGHLVESDLSDTIMRLDGCPNSTVRDVDLATPADRDEVSSARVRLAVDRAGLDETMQGVRELADEKALHVIEPQVDDEGA